MSTKMDNLAQETVPEPEIAPTKLDFGCGPNKQPGFTGVDIKDFPGVDVIMNLGDPTEWPWESESIEEVFSSHFVEHLEAWERVNFFNNLYRVMKTGGKATIITPHWSNDCAYGDWSHKWPPMSGWYAFYLHKDWRKGNAPHSELVCDFDFVIGGSWEGWLETRNPEFRTNAMARNVNSYRDLYVTLTKRAPS